MDIKEFRKLAKAGTTVYLTSCALLISAFIHAATQDLSVYHAMIVLNLSWLNNATAVIPLSLTLLATSFRREGMYTLWKSEEPNLKSVRHSLIAELIACLLHFCIMAAFGIWLFSRISTFDKASSNCTPSTVFYFLGHDVPVTNKHFSNLWLYIYYYTLIPVVNVVTLLVLCFSPTLLLVHLLSRYTNQFRKGKVAGRAIKIIIGGAAAIFLELIIIIGTEGTISRNTVAPGEHIWTFGQTLALLVMVFLAWDLFKDLKDSYRGKQWRRARESSRSARSTASLMDAVDRLEENVLRLQHFYMDHDFNELDNDGVVDGNALNFRSLVDKISDSTEEFAVDLQRVTLDDKTNSVSWRFAQRPE